MMEETKAIPTSTSYLSEENKIFGSDGKTQTFPDISVSLPQTKEDIYAANLGLLDFPKKEDANESTGNRKTEREGYRRRKEPSFPNTLQHGFDFPPSMKDIRTTTSLGIPNFDNERDADSTKKLKTTVSNRQFTRSNTMKIANNPNVLSEINERGRPLFGTVGL